MRLTYYLKHGLLGSLFCSFNSTAKAAVSAQAKNSFLKNAEEALSPDGNSIGGLL